MGVEQTREGSHAIDVCTAFVGRDEIAEMTEMVSRMRGSVSAPLVFDPTEMPVLEASLQLYGGKPTLNSINFEDGEEAAHRRLELAREFPAALISLTTEIKGMDTNAAGKARRATRPPEYAYRQPG